MQKAATCTIHKGGPSNSSGKLFREPKLFRLNINSKVSKNETLTVKVRSVSNTPLGPSCLVPALKAVPLGVELDFFSAYIYKHIVHLRPFCLSITGHSYCATQCPTVYTGFGFGCSALKFRRQSLEVLEITLARQTNTATNNAEWLCSAYCVHTLCTMYAKGKK